MKQSEAWAIVCKLGKMKTDTLSFRLFLFTTLWMLISLAIVAILVSQDYRRTVEKQFEDLITANLYNVMGSIKRGDDGELSGTPPLGDARYQQYHSGWYWTVGSLNIQDVNLSSSSLAGLKFPSLDATKFDADFQRSYRAKDGAENSLMIVEAKAYLGEGEEIYAFRTSGNMGVLDEEITNFQRRLILLLVIFGVGLIVTSFAIVRFELRPLAFATSQLSSIRNGEADQIKGKFPREIMPLIDETNALIKSNQSIVERSRTQVGNLAHSLKTPLSVLSLEVKNMPASLKTIAQTQLDAMNSQIQSYLNRAMISARHGTITSRTDVHKSLLRLVRTFNKLVPEITFIYTNSDEATNQESAKKTDPFAGIFAGEQQDFEEIIGNILENAGKYARQNVEIIARQLPNEAGSRIEIEIADDGSGLTNTQMKYVLKRGNRLDENKPGTGLGLSIVTDILKEYGGDLKLEQASTGGLKILVQLPGV